jgi:hypothetical protein
MTERTKEQRKEEGGTARAEKLAPGQGGAKGRQGGGTSREAGEAGRRETAAGRLRMSRDSTDPFSDVPRKEQTCFWVRVIILHRSIVIGRKPKKYFEGFLKKKIDKRKLSGLLKERARRLNKGFPGEPFLGMQ